MVAKKNNLNCRKKNQNRLRKNKFMVTVLKITQMSHGYQQQMEAHALFKLACLDIFRKKHDKYTNTPAFRINPLKIKQKSEI